MQAELTEMQSRLWENDEMTDEEAEELERQATLLKIRMTAASEHIKQWGMETGLNRFVARTPPNKHAHSDRDTVKVSFKLRDGANQDRDEIKVASSWLTTRRAEQS